MTYSNPNPSSAVSDTSPAWNYAAVTPHDSTDLDTLTRAIYVGGAGDVVAVRWDNSTVTFSGVAAGSVLPIAVRRINSTSTTATGIVALF